MYQSHESFLLLFLLLPLSPFLFALHLSHHLLLVSRYEAENEALWKKLKQLHDKQVRKEAEEAVAWAEREATRLHPRASFPHAQARSKNRDQWEHCFGRLRCDSEPVSAVPR